MCAELRRLMRGAERRCVTHQVYLYAARNHLHRMSAHTAEAPNSHEPFAGRERNAPLSCGGRALSHGGWRVARERGAEPAGRLRLPRLRLGPRPSTVAVAFLVNDRPKDVTRPRWTVGEEDGVCQQAKFVRRQHEPCSDALGASTASAVTASAGTAAAAHQARSLIATKPSD